MNPALEPWANFNVAVAGASAALAGLIIVAMSVNLDGILAAPAIVARGGAAIGALVLAVMAACLTLVPGQSLFALGLEILLGAVAALAMALAAARDIYRVHPPRRRLPFKLAMSMLSPVLFTIGASLLLADNAAGLNWVAAGAVVSIVAGVGIGWITLIEIRR